MRDSTFTKRGVKKRMHAGMGGIPEPIKSVAKDIMSGMGELKRQSGAAVANIKEGYRRIKSSLSR